MRIPDDTPVRFVPDLRRGDPDIRHTGRVAGKTTDGLYRMWWDDPNPQPDYFNTERVFRPEQIERIDSDG